MKALLALAAPAFFLSLLACGGGAGSTGATGPSGSKGDPGAPGEAVVVQTDGGSFVVDGGVVVVEGVDHADSLFGNSTGTFVHDLGGGAGPSNYCILGEIHLLAYTLTNVGGGLVPAEGQLLSISQNTALFSLLGTSYGGDGITKFKVPDLRGSAPNRMQYVICVSGVFP